MKSLALVLAAFAGIAAAPPPAPDPLLWPEEQRAFFQDGPGLLLTDEQHAGFRRKSETARGAFVREFLGRDPAPETPENELRLGIERRRRLALLAHPSFLDARSQILFLRGLPTSRKRVACRALRPLEIWEYGPGQPPLVVYRPKLPVPFRLWLPEDTRRVLYDGSEPPDARLEEKLAQNARASCPEFAEVERATSSAGRKDKAAQERVQVLPEDRARVALGPADLAAWARQAAVTPLPPPPPPLEAGVMELDFPRTLGKQLAVRALLPVSPAGPQARITLSAVIESGGRIVDEYQARYRLPEGSQAVPLLLERHVSPGLPFLLRLRLWDEVSGAEVLVTRGSITPRKPEARLSDTVRAAVLGEPLRLADRVGPDSLLLPPPGQAVPGVWRVEPLITGSRITRVVFQVDGQVRASLSRPPFASEVLLGAGDREQVVRVEGYDENDLPVAADEVVVQPAQGGSGTPTFKVNLAAAPASNSTAAGGAVLARAQVVVPQGRRVETVEIRLNDVPVATLTVPPWEARVDVPAEEPMVYLSAVARLDDGRQAEDVHFLRAPDTLQEVNVRLVELHATVTDRSDRPVADLTADDFEIREDGRPQSLARFERVQDLSLNLGLVIDSSGSMTGAIAETQRAAAGFLSRIIRPRDRSFILGIGSRPFLLSAPTGNAGAMMKAELPDLRAEGRTALYDALAAAIFLFREGRGQRAIVLLSDGNDTMSHATRRQVLDLARRSGVTIYAIGLGLVPVDVHDRPVEGLPLPGERSWNTLRGQDIEDRADQETPRAVLAQLAAETGGRVFYISRAEELEEVYSLVGEDLRSSYLLVYQTELGDEGGVRPVEVRVKKRGLKVRTAQGYSP